MKKLKPKQKVHLLRKSAKELRNRRKSSKRSKRKYYGRYLDKIKYIEPAPVYAPLKAPKHFTLCAIHCSEVITYINQIKAKAFNKENVNVLLEEIETIDAGAVAMLLSVIEEFENLNLKFKGNKPKNPSANAILEKSGFFNYFVASVDPENKKTKNTILRTGSNKTNPIEFAPEVHRAMETVWGISGRCPGVHAGIIEMVRNSCDHAFPERKGAVWHLGVSHSESDNQVDFSFVDNGEGIIETLNNGKLRKVLNLFLGADDILLTAFEDGIKSRTGLPWRGKGLPAIYEMVTDGIIANLVVITNNVYLDLPNGTKKVLPVSYQGTCYSWKINPSCVKQVFQN